MARLLPSPTSYLRFGLRTAEHIFGFSCTHALKATPFVAKWPEPKANDISHVGSPLISLMPQLRALRFEASVALQHDVDFEHQPRTSAAIQICGLYLRDAGGASRRLLGCTSPVKRARDRLHGPAPGSLPEASSYAEARSSCPQESEQTCSVTSCERGSTYTINHKIGGKARPKGRRTPSQGGEAASMGSEPSTKAWQPSERHMGRPRARMRGQDLDQPLGLTLRPFSLASCPGWVRFRRLRKFLRVRSTALRIQCMQKKNGSVGADANAS